MIALIMFLFLAGGQVRTKPVAPGGQAAKTKPADASADEPILPWLASPSTDERGVQMSLPAPAVCDLSGEGACPLTSKDAWDACVVSVCDASGKCQTAHSSGSLEVGRSPVGVDSSVTVHAADGTTAVKLSDAEYAHLQALRQAVVDEEKRLAVEYGARPSCKSPYFYCYDYPAPDHYEYHGQFLLIDRGKDKQ